MRQTNSRILRRRQAISVPPPVTPHPVVRPDPGLHREIDFCSVTPRSAEAPDKHQNGLEVFNVMDRGSSASITSLPTAHFDAELALLSIATLQQHGVPRTIILDRDPRFVRQPIDRRFPLGVHALFAVFLLCSGYAAATPP